jgi:hypothetical protein
MSLPNGYWPVVQTFGIDQYRTFNNPFRETWQPYFANDDPNNSNWPVFIEGVAIPRSAVPAGMIEGVGDLLDIWPRTVYYGGPCARYYAPQYRAIFENWAHSLGMACDTDVIPVTPNYPSFGLAFPSTNFTWYVATETRPPKRYRLMRNFGAAQFHWVDNSFDTWKYKNFHAQNPTVT